MASGKINEDLLRERKKCIFNVQELINIVDGGEKMTKMRKEVETIVFNTKELWDDVPEEYLSHKERYELAVKKACILYEILKDHILEHSGFEDFAPSNTYRVLSSTIKDITPLMLHMGMFVPTILGQASPEQLAKWLPLALNLHYIGTYAQTELGHGTFLRGLETTATYDPKTEEFILHSPTLTSYKWWPGGLAHTANHCIVVAQLHTKGEFQGIYPFFVQIRDIETHMPLPGISVGEIGPKQGFQTANNGFLGFDHFRIPRENMLMKNAQVLKDGTMVKSTNDKLTYGTMVFVRVSIVNDVSFEIARAVTIAVRYAAVRHQSQLKPNQPEPQIIDYVTQQHKLFVPIATSHAFRIVGDWLWKTFASFNRDMKLGNTEQLPELHALACCMKAVCSKDASICVEQCRWACGGHGYMTSSNLPIIYGVTTASVTYEGEYTVMLLQTARYLVKAWKQALEGKAMTPTVGYMLNFLNNNNVRWDNTPEGIIRGLQAVAAGKTKTAYDSIKRHQRSGKDYEDSWNLSSVQLVNSSEAHCRAVLCEVYWQETQKIAKSASANLGIVLTQLSELYLVYWAIEKTGDLLMFSTISKSDILILQQRYEELLGLIRPNAVGLVDGFDLADKILNSTLGAYDGMVYERLMAEAKKSPLNAEPVNQSFHKYLKPLIMKGKL
ncbi:probable peroxisomal acyl-coenzyme A oxidase 1 [Hyposmocoma kahamanoa]|uniref:probable peroxisomal acyl-coenzyme A oxidase 1 n=1 Tax=Hyposmocoma kahamanoa TaxID=1477025 RepID=UPI000E6D5B8E|nr:probable peroxisomal acyl-coenzyme A oxidase 1 [Hyposmocoma kahamanoa]